MTIDGNENMRSGQEIFKGCLVSIFNKLPLTLSNYSTINIIISSNYAFFSASIFIIDNSDIYLLESMVDSEKMVVGGDE